MATNTPRSHSTFTLYHCTISARNPGGGKYFLWGKFGRPVPARVRSGQPRHPGACRGFREFLPTGKPWAAHDDVGERRSPALVDMRASVASAAQKPRCLVRSYPGAVTTVTGS
jgi:hypothetical protein